MITIRLNRYSNRINNSIIRSNNLNINQKRSTILKDNFKAITLTSSNKDNIRNMTVTEMNRINKHKRLKCSIDNTTIPITMNKIRNNNTISHINMKMRTLQIIDLKAIELLLILVIDRYSVMTLQFSHKAKANKIRNQLFKSSIPMGGTIKVKNMASSNTKRRTNILIKCNKTPSI